MSIDVVWRVDDAARAEVEACIRATLASHALPPEGEPPPVAGATRYTAGDAYVVDRQRDAWAGVGSSPPSTPGRRDDVPWYDVVAAAGEAAGGAPQRGGRGGHAGGCFNCGGGHTAAMCPLPYDAVRVRGAAREQRSRRDSRYFGDAGAAGGHSVANVVPGVLSAALRAALGLAPDEPPRFLRRMRRFGYPPSFAAPPASGRERHWGYASNGPLSAAVASLDGGYAARGGADGGDDGDGGDGSGATLGASERLTMDVDDGGEGAGDAAARLSAGAAHADAGTAPLPPPLAGGGGDAAVVTSLFASPLLARARLQPLFPLCTCRGAAAAPVPIPGLNAEWWPPTPDSADMEVEADAEPEATAGEEGEVASVARGGGGGFVAAPLPAAPFAAAGAGDAGRRRYPPPCIVDDGGHRQCLIHGASGSAPAAPAPSADAIVPVAAVDGAPPVAVSTPAASPPPDSAAVGVAVAAPPADADAAVPAVPLGSGSGTSYPRLARFLVPRDGAALAAAAAAYAESWSAAIGGSLDTGVNAIISDGLRRQPRRGAGGGGDATAGPGSVGAGSSDSDGAS